MAMPTPQEAAQRWAQNLGASTDKIRKGIERVNESPMAKAAQAQDRFLQGINEAVSSGKWAAGLNRVTLDQWKTAFLQKGITRIAQGASQATAKMQAHLAEFLPYVAQGVAMLPPKGGAEAGRARMNAMFDHLSKYRRNR